jgi:hypothetical protein
MMTFVAFVVERRLLKALKKESKPLEGNGGEPEVEPDLSAAV